MRKYFHKLFSMGREAQSIRRTMRKPHLERLEDRTTPSLSAVGPEFHVNTFTTSTQRAPAIATDTAGNFVVVWQSLNQAGASSGYDVYAQRYNAVGVPQGGEFLVNTVTTGRQFGQSVAMDSTGNFVAAWEGVDASGYGVFAQRFNAAGMAQGGEIALNSYTTSSQRAPSIAMDSAGNFVATWASLSQDGSSYGIFGRRYNSAGVAQGGEFQVNQFINASQYFPSVSADTSGDFVVTWSSQNQEGDASQYGVYARRFSSAGVPQGDEFPVNQYTTNSQRLSRVALDSDGDFAIVWQSYFQDGSLSSTHVRRFTAAGVPLGGESRVNTFTVNQQGFPSVASTAGGDFVVTFQTNGPDGSGYGIYAREYAANGLPTSGQEFRVNTTTTGNQAETAIAIDAAGNAIVAWYSNTSAVDTGYGIFAQRYNQVADTVPPTVADLYSDDRLRIQPGNAVATTNLGFISVEFSENMSQTGGAGGANSVLNPANYQLTRNGIDVSSLITGVTFGTNPQSARPEATLTFSRPLLNGDYVLTVRTAIRDTAGNGVDGDGNGTAGPDFTRAFTVTPQRAVGDEFQVNVTTNGSQFASAVAAAPNGDFTIAFVSNDGSGYGIYLRRYNAAGAATSPFELRANTFALNSQRDPAIAMDSSGNFIVVWGSNNQAGEASQYDIYGQRYNAAGVAQGGEFLINTFTTARQALPSVSMDANGNFVVGWESNQDGSGYGIYAQRFNAAGVAQGGEFLVNVATLGSQRFPSVAAAPTGDFTIAYTNNDLNGYGIFARRYNAAGVAQGTEFLVNQVTTGAQTLPEISMDAAGNFVVVWDSNNQEGASSQYGVYGRRFNAAGTALGGEFAVNQYTTSQQRYAALAVADSGDFVVSWSSLNQENNGYEVYARQYASSGTARGGEYRVNVFATAFQYISAVAIDADGDFVVAWTSAGQDGSGYGIFAQRFASVAPNVVAAAPVTMLEDGPNAVVDLQTVFDDLEEGPAVLVYTVQGNSNPGLVTPSITGGTNLTLALVAQQNGTANITIRATDSIGKFVETIVTVNVTPVNDRPTFTASNPPASNEEAGPQTVTNWATFNSGQPNEAQNVFAYYVTGVTNPGLFSVLPSVANNGTLTYTAAPNANGTSQITVIVRDDGGIANNGLDTSTPQNFTITVNNVNDAPTLVIPGTASVGEGSTITFTAIGADPFDNPANGLTYSLVTPPVGATINPTTGAFSFTPPNGPTVHNISVRVTDNGTPNLFTTQVFALTVTNYPPTMPAAPPVFAPIAGYVATGNFIDPGADSWTGTVNYGDNTGTGPLSINQAAHTFALNHVYALPGVYTVNITITDSDGATGTQVRTVTVVAPAKVSSTLVNGNTTQNRSRVTSLVVNFDSTVSLPGTIANAFTLTRTGGGAVTFAASSQVVGGVTVVTLNNFSGPETDFGSLRDGRYTLTALASQITEPLAGQQLDGDANGTAGGNYTFGDGQGLYRFFGDVTGLDRRIDISDFGFFSLAYLTPANYNPVLDFNADGRIDIADFGQFSIRYFTSLP